MQYKSGHLHYKSKYLWYKSGYLRYESIICGMNLNISGMNPDILSCASIPSNRKQRGATALAFKGINKSFLFTL